MSHINTDTITSSTIAALAVRGANDQERINHVCTLAFAGKTFVAPNDSILHGAYVILAKKADDFRKDKKSGKLDKGERFQAINILNTMVSRWLRKQERFSGRRVSARTTGEVSVALVERKDNNHKAKPKGKAAAKDTGIKGVKDLASLLQYAVDNYGLETVQAAAAKLS